MQGRFIGTNLRKLIDIINDVEQEQINALYISIDFEKCFDTVEYVAIEGAIQFFNFGPYMISIFKLLCNQFQTCVVNNGHTSRVSSCPINPIFLELSYKVLYFQQMSYKSYIFNKNSNFCQ